MTLYWLVLIFVVYTLVKSILLERDNRKKLLLAQQIFGINDPDQAFPQGKAKLEELLAQARSKGIPEEVVHTNTTMGCGDDFEQGDEEEF